MSDLQFARSTKYAATVAVKSLMETEGEEKRERIRRDDKNCNHRLTIKGSELMVGKIIVRIVRLLLLTAMSWNTPKKTPS